MLPPPDTHPSALAAYRALWQDAIQKCLKPPPEMTLPQWADEFRYLSMSAGAIGGRWRTSRVEVARGPMLATTEPDVDTVTCMVSTQLLKTELLLNVIGYHIHLDPCPMLLVQPKDDAVDAFSKERLAPMFRATPVLADIMDPRTRRSEDTLGFKQFPGGFLALAAAGSPTNLAMRAIRITLLDEVDKYPTTKEGDPILLAEERSSTFQGRRLSLRCCSPTWEETSRIWASYQDSDQRRPHVKCPHCGEWLCLDFFRHVHWAKSRPDTALVYCDKCGAAWAEPQRLQALQEIRWRQTKPFVCCDEGQDPRQTQKWEWDPDAHVDRAMCQFCGQEGIARNHAGFTASKLYSPRTTVAELATRWHEVHQNPEARQTFFNTQLALPYKVEATKEVPTGLLAKRQEAWGDVPDEVIVITAGVDVQPGSNDQEGRLEMEVVGWGLGEESWSLAYEVFTGDPSKPEVWRQLDEYLLTPVRRQDGRMMAIRGCCVDSGGHNTQEAYAFAAVRGNRNIWAIKGMNDRGGQWSPIWPTMRTQNRFKPGYRPVMVGVSAAKEAIRQRLLVKDPGPGYCHFPNGRPPAYYDQLTAERLVVERTPQGMVRRWTVPAGRANEALDARVYAYAALWGLYHVRRLSLDRLSAQFVEQAARLPHNPDPADPDLPPAEQLPPARVVPVRRRVVGRSQWMNYRG